jgi:DNA-binding transcriptional LysR family regulator
VLSVRELECLVVLADELSFTRAASQLQVSQPTLSQMVKGIDAGDRHPGASGR